MPTSNVLLVEPRKHAAALPALENIRRNLPETEIVWFHGTKNKDFARDVASKVGNVRLREMPVENLKDGHEYSSFMLNPGLWRELRHYARRDPTSKTLVTQTDAGFCHFDTAAAHAQLRSLEDVDYIGAPGRSHYNGGISYRGIDGMLRVVQGTDDIAIDSGLWDSGNWLTEWHPENRKAEDQVFSRECHNHPERCRLASRDQASLFSCCTVTQENPTSIFSTTKKTPLAFHGHKHHFVGGSPSQPFPTLDAMFASCPGAEAILSNQFVLGDESESIM